MTDPPAARTLYRETLPPPVAVWIVALLLVGSLGIAYGFYLGTIVGLLSAGLPGALVVWWFVSTTPVVEVTGTHLRAGRARLPLSYVGDIRTLDRDATRRLRGPDGAAEAYWLQRSWITTAVAVEVTDPRDPHPYWLVSTRHPEALADALTAAVGVRRDPEARG